jgi:hypothetical protein
MACIAANAAVTPALAAAGYLNLYIKAVRLREQAAADRRQIQTRHAAEQVIEEDAAWRLRSLQAEAVPARFAAGGFGRYRYRAQYPRWERTAGVSASPTASTSSVIS